MIEAVVLVPVAMLIVLVAVQACLWVHAQTLVASAADQGDAVACTNGGTLDQGIGEARRLLSSSAASIVTGPTFNGAVLSDNEVQLEVSGAAESIVPWFHLPVSAVRVGTKQEFRVSG